MELIDEQWARLDPLIPEPRRPILDGVLWVLRTGAQWKDLPDRYPPHTTAHLRFQAWARRRPRARPRRACHRLAGTRGDRCQRVLRGWHLRGGQKGGGGCPLGGMGKTKRGKGTKLMAVADRAGLPIAICTASASPHEVTLVDAVLNARFVDAVPERLIGDKAYDSYPLDERLVAQGIAMIAPHREKRKTPDGRVLRQYKRRWKIECLFAWLGNFRRLVVRYGRHVENYRGFVHLGCILILLRQGL